MPLFQQKHKKNSNKQEENQNGPLSKYMRQQDINFLYYITQESVEDSDFDSKNFKQLKAVQETQKGIPKGICSQEIIENEGRNDLQLKNVSSQKSFSFNKSIMTPDQQFDKLLQITSRCIDYYNRFSEQKNHEFNIIQKTFNDLSLNLSSAFQEIINQVNKKNQQINKYLKKKHSQIISHKNCQDQKLKITLDEIKSVHLCNLLAQKESIMMNSRSMQRNVSIINQNPQISQDKQKSLQLSIQLHNYATTLNKFYCLMQQIQTNNFKEVVQDCVNFINNLITEQIKSIVYQKIPNRIQQKINKGFIGSYNSVEENIFLGLLQSTTKSLSSDSTDSLFKDININLKELQQKQINQLSLAQNGVLSQKKYNQQNIQRGQFQKQKGQQNKNKNSKFKPKILDLNISLNTTPKKSQRTNLCPNLTSQINRQTNNQQIQQVSKFLEEISRTQQKRQKKISAYNDTFELSEQKITSFSPSQVKKIATASKASLKKTKNDFESKLTKSKQLLVQNNENFLQGRKGQTRNSISKLISHKASQDFSRPTLLQSESRKSISRSASKQKSRNTGKSGSKITAHRIIQIL